MKKTLLSAMLLLAAATLSAECPIVTDPGSHPQYSDRAAWGAAAVENAETYVQTARKALSREWEPVMFSDWKKYTQTGDEACMKARTDNAACLEAMIVAELLEGKGTYILHITDYAWLQATCPYWNAADVALEKAVMHYFKKELDALDPSICKTIGKAVAKHGAAE